MVEKKVDLENLEHYKRLAGFRYKDLYNNIIDKLCSKKDSGRECATAVQKYSVLFGAVFNMVNNQAKDTLHPAAVSDDIALLYSAYVASKVVCKDLEASSENGFSRSMALESRIYKSYVPETKGEHVAMRNTLENLVDFIAESCRQPAESILSYFSEYNSQVASEIAAIAPKITLEKIKDLKWIIGPYEVEGIKPAVAANDATKIKSVSKEENQQFYTPLTYLHIPKNKVLRRERIIGDPNVITFLERMVHCLFMYNPNVRKNPMADEGIFRNRVILQGLPGGGKGAISYYIINKAEEINHKINGNKQNQDGSLMVTCFNINSSYKDGKIQKLKSQFNQVVNENRIFLLFEDEIDGLLKEESPGKQDASDLQVIQEFNKFLDGQYPNNGNYLLLANVNNINNLSAANKSRFYIINWQGAVAKEDQGRLFKYKLERGAEHGFVSISDEDFTRLGELSYKGGLNGRDITVVCEAVCSDAFDWRNVGEIYDLKKEYSRQIEQIRRMYNKVTYANVEAKVLEVIKNKAAADAESIALAQGVVR